jgi:hypothetical protein
MSKFNNNFGHDIETFVSAMSQQHRTLQQCFTNVCLSWLRHLAETEDYDLRNEASVKIAKKIVDAVEDVSYRLPYI